MTSILQFSLWAAVAALSLAAADGNARAATPYDGPWHVTITTVRGTCGSGVGFGLQIRDGRVYGYSSDVNVGGQVSRSGAVQVSLSTGQQHASGSSRCGRSAVAENARSIPAGVALYARPRPEVA